MTDKLEKFSLFRIFRFNDRKAYSDVFEKYAPSLKRYLLIKMPNRVEAEEVLSEVFLKGWEYFTSNQVEYPGALLRTIARGQISDFYRKRAVQKQIIVEESGQLGDKGVAAGRIEDDVDITFIKSTLRKLKEEHQIVITLRYLEQRSINEIAVQIGKSESNTRVIIHRATKALRNIFE